MIAVVDYGLGNLASVRNAFRCIDIEVEVTRDAATIARADGIVIPGVGAASAGMERLHGYGLDTVILEAAHSGKPLLGLCLGMQLLFDRSEEGDTACLGLLAGTVHRLQHAEKIPHIGWNKVEGDQGPMWEGLSPNPYCYFVHSYICQPDDPRVASGYTSYGDCFCSAVCHGSLWGTQFHPERSGRVGLQIIRNFSRICTLDRKFLSGAPSSQ